VISRQAAVLHGLTRCGNVVADLLAEQVPSERLACTRGMWQLVTDLVITAIAAQTNVLVQGWHRLGCWSPLWWVSLRVSPCSRE
jgi:hypothetical protein